MYLSKHRKDGFGNGKNMQAQELMYQHMSNHYSRILNAKPVVDTSAPRSFKPHLVRKGISVASAQRERVRLWKDSHYDHFSRLSHEDKLLLNQIVASDKFNPVLFRDGLGGNATGIHVPPSKTKGSQIRNPVDIVELHKERFESEGPKFWPKILRTEAESKLKGMRVYHPPRRRPTFQKEEWEGSNIFEQEDKDLCEGREEEVKEISQTSSRDSAYNEGTSSTVDSRSPTPLETRKRGFCNSATQTSVEETRPRSRTPSFKRENEEDLEYIKLIHEITNELVEKGHFTDKALSRVIRRRVTAKKHLDQVRVTEEVKKLRKRLGITNCEIEEEKLEMCTAPPPRKTSLSYDVSDTDSWTAHFIQLSRVNSGDDSSEFNQNRIVIKSAHSTPVEMESSSSVPTHLHLFSGGTRVEIQDDDDDEIIYSNGEDKDSDDSSFESTIKENLQIDTQQGDDRSGNDDSSSSSQS